jgi:hypothetical protein
MGVLTAIPSVVQIKASRAYVDLAHSMGTAIPEDIQERADWPIEKAWDYRPPLHPIVDEPAADEPAADLTRSRAGAASLAHRLRNVTRLIAALIRGQRPTPWVSRARSSSTARQ